MLFQVNFAKNQEEMEEYLLSYRLVIAEKPSVGAAYAKVLGATNRQDGYWEEAVILSAGA